MSSSDWFRLILGVVMIAGTVAAAWFTAVASYRRLHWFTVPATVASSFLAKVSSSEDGGRNEQWRTTASFTNGHGKTRSARLKVGRKIPVGHTIQIRHDPRNPSVTKRAMGAGSAASSSPQHWYSWLRHGSRPCRNYWPNSDAPVGG
ncbi:MAG: DUF3592 domain-containing protein [Beutenbergiaceae bacterium]